LTKVYCSIDLHFFRFSASALCIDNLFSIDVRRFLWPPAQTVKADENSLREIIGLTSGAGMTVENTQLLGKLFS
jgi:hypothetical protein